MPLPHDHHQDKKAMRKHLFHGALLMCLLAAKADDFCLVFDFAEPDRKIIGKGTVAAQGVFHPSADADNDNQETTAVSSYRKTERGKPALFFSAENKSYAVIDEVKALSGQALETLYIRLTVKPGTKSMQYLVGNKSDAANTGFALFKWGNTWRFNFGDGDQTFSVRGRNAITPPDQWTTLEVLFDRGDVTIREDGQVITQSKAAGAKIAPNPGKLGIGNYVTSNKRIYASDGGYELLVLASSETAAAPWVDQLAQAAPAPAADWKIKALCEPVDGNEIHFNGRKTLHTFYDAPVPVTFMMTFQDNPSPVLKLVVPPEVSLLEAFASNHNQPSKCFQVIESRLPDGRRAYHTPPGELRGELPPGPLGRGENVTVMLACPRSFTAGTVEWSVQDGDATVHRDAFRLVPQDLPPELPPGRFHFMCYSIQDIAFHDLGLVDRIGRLFARTGITSKGRYYKRDPRRCAVDDRLAGHGFSFYEISPWSGPARNRNDFGAIVPAARDANGSELPMNCPAQLAASPEANQLYQAMLTESLIVENTHAAILDYEPWSAPGKYCFCPYCMDLFRTRAKLPAGVELTPDIIKGKYRAQWVEHWLENTRLYMKMMADAVHKAGPQLEIWDYTYVFPYDDDEALSKRQWSIPKDPRRCEEFIDCSMLSLYHLNGRAALDQLELSRRHLQRQLCGISLISRANDHAGRYTSPEECLSPQRLYQKAVVAGALGHELFAIYPGSWIDGSAHVSLNRAAREVRLREDFYVNGKRRDDARKITTSAKRDDFAVLIHERDHRLLATVFNFTDAPITATIERHGDVMVEAHGVAFVDLP